MSECNWLGMDLFGTAIRGPEVSQLPSGIMRDGVSVSIEHTVSLSVSSGTFSDVPVDSNNHALEVAFTPTKGSHSLLVSLNLSGRAWSDAAATAAQATQIRFQTLINGNRVWTQIGDSADQLLVANSSVQLGGTIPQPRFSGFFCILVPPELLPATRPLQFKVQFSVSSVLSQLHLDFDAKENALVVQEIGPVSVT